MNGTSAGTVDEDGFGRLSTGIAELDEILAGGVPRNSINIVMGHPGTGKTILAEQMLFHNAGGDRPVLYLTTLSEPLAKVVTYLQRFSFFDPMLLGDKVVYDDIGNELAERGPEIVVDKVREYIREIGPRIIVIDSFKAIHDLTESPTLMRRIMAELAGVLTAYDTTTFLVGEYDEDQIPRFPEFAVADGIIEFARRSTAKRDERFLRVLKLRGSRYAEGFHAFTISSDGLKIYPRLVTPRVPASFDRPRERVPTGTPDLDALMAGGLWLGSSALVVGQAGSGKTTLALQFAMEAARRGQPALYVNFQENPTQLRQTIASLGGDVDALQEAGLSLQYASPVELQIDSIVVELFETVRREGVTRVAIDALTDLALAASDQERFHDYLYSLSQHLTVNGVTSLYTLEASPRTSYASTKHEARFSSMSDTLIELGIQMRDEPVRTLRIIKSRGTAHDLRVHRMIIGEGGARLDGPLGGS